MGVCRGSAVMPLSTLAVSSSLGRGREDTAKVVKGWGWKGEREGEREDGIVC